MKKIAIILLISFIAAGPIMAVDNASFNVTVTVDIPPAAPAVNSYVTPTREGIQLISGTKEADSSLCINGAEKIPINMSTVWSVSVTLAEGQNILRITSKDPAGNESDAAIITILLDTIGPGVTSLSVNPVTTHLTTVVSGTVELPADIKELRLTGPFDGSPVIIPKAEFASGSFTRQVTMVSSGDILAAAYDMLGNTGAQRSVAVTLEKSLAPSIVNISPADGTMFEVGDAVPFNINAADPEGDAIQYKIMVDGQVVYDWSSDPIFNWQTASQSPGIRQATILVKDIWGSESSGNMSIYFAIKALDMPHEP